MKHGCVVLVVAAVIGLALGACFDNILSPQTVNNLGQSQGGTPSPLPSPSCVTGSLVIEPAQATLAVGDSLVFAVKVLDINGAAIPPICRQELTADKDGGCALLSQDPPSIRAESQPGCDVTVFHGGRSTTAVVTITQ
jgi:hypothetical protein